MTILVTLSEWENGWEETGKISTLILDQRSEVKSKWVLRGNKIIWNW